MMPPNAMRDDSHLVRHGHLQTWRAVGVAALVAAMTLLVQAADWKQATAGYRFEFPRDHASHPDYKIEWWYYTGNLQSADGRRFGYQVTFFRVGIDPAPANPSRWAVSS
jgi:predicted secreted hydrolase